MTDKTFVLEWIRYASDDLFTARHMFEDVYPKRLGISVWHSQQCAEKALKAFLVANDIDPPKIHNLNRLGELCGNIDGEFFQIEIPCAKLNPLGAEIRYPNELAVDESAAKTAIEDAQKIYDFCAAKINLLDGIR